jgi:HlyD family secretion protein
MGEPAAGWRGGRRRWAWPVAAAVALGLIGYGVAHALTGGAGARPVPPATVAVDTGAVTTRVATTGTLQPAQTRSLSFTAAGTVDSVTVTPGATVGAGQVLAKLDSTTAADQVDAAQQALDEAESALTQARASAASPPTCPAVAAAYVRPSPSPTPSATATPRPSGSPAAPPSPAPARSRSAGPGGSRPKPSPAPGAGGGRTSCSNGGQRAQGGGTDPLLGAQQRVNQAQVTLENAEDVLDGTTITAPISGRVLAVGGTVGSQVTAGSPFITLADTYDMQISAAFPEADADHLAVRQPATATLANRPGQTFRATVVQVDPVGTTDGSMVRYGVLLSFADPPGDLLVGQSAGVVVTTGSVVDTVRVPTTAVHVAGHAGTVLRSVAGRTAPVAVGVGLVGDQYTQITSGLAAGDTVVRSW